MSTSLSTAPASAPVAKPERLPLGKVSSVLVTAIEPGVNRNGGAYVIVTVRSADNPAVASSKGKLLLIGDEPVVGEVRNAVVHMTKWADKSTSFTIVL